MSDMRNLPFAVILTLGLASAGANGEYHQGKTNSNRLPELGEEAGRQSRPAGWSLLHIVFDSLHFGFGEDRETIGD